MIERFASWFMHRFMHEVWRLRAGHPPVCNECGRDWMTNHLFGRKYRYPSFRAASADVAPKTKRPRRWGTGFSDIGYGGKDDGFYSSLSRRHAPIDSEIKP
jgi:hypothetical protein